MGGTHTSSIVWMCVLHVFHQDFAFAVLPVTLAPPLLIPQVLANMVVGRVLGLPLERPKSLTLDAINKQMLAQTAKKL
jgi:hypothetical protein